MEESKEHVENIVKILSMSGIGFPSKRGLVKEYVKLCVLFTDRETVDLRDLVDELVGDAINKLAASKLGSSKIDIKCGNSWYQVVDC